MGSIEKKHDTRKENDIPSKRLSMQSHKC